MKRPRKKAMAWAPDGRTLVPLEPGLVPRPRHVGATDPAWWTEERRARQSEFGRKGKTLQYKRRDDRA
jgi:hypothetical protein